MSEKKKLNMIVQPYAGKLMIIQDILAPPIQEDDPNQQPGSYFNFPKLVDTFRTFLKEAGYKTDRGDYNQLIDGILCALETYMKHILQVIIKNCEFRVNFHLINDKRCKFNHILRDKVNYLNEMKRGASDERYSRKMCRRRAKVRQSDPGFRRYQNEKRLACINYTAMLALGVHKRVGTVLFDPFSAPYPRNGRTYFGASNQNHYKRLPTVLHQKYIKVQDVLQLLEQDPRFKYSMLLYEAYMRYPK
ncbi:uncharacterized protein LOC6643624 [Drosophila willistoni]|nr:uncharacterized protein LOC6643624 [Drosophila willistoni]